MNWLQLALTIEQQIPGLIAAAKAIRENHGQLAKPIQEYHDEAAAILAQIQATAAKEQGQ